mmetsp:Transcript_70913/g.197036  ORF Transcript_70913/g.197036 Transcript_70913/m.197036 type:complete len:403 (+) Transcript_70913:47-1255(+)
MMLGPPAEALVQEDGSHVHFLGDGSSLRWAQHPDGTWGRPEHRRASASKLAEAEANGNGSSNGHETARLKGPPPGAVEHSDGSFLLELDDQSTLRWTRRADGSWRKPEHKRSGWVGDLESEKYLPPPARVGEEEASPECSEAPTHSVIGTATAETDATSVASHDNMAALLTPMGEAIASPPEGKHMLQRRWCLWIHLRRTPSRQSAASTDNLKLVHEFDTVEDFWCMHHYANPPSKYANADYSLVERGVKPVWDDPGFENGGRWVTRLEGSGRTKDLDEIWLHLSMSLIGEAFADCGGQMIRGATMSMRGKGTKIALWFTIAKDKRMVTAVGCGCRDVLADMPGERNLARRDWAFEDFQKAVVTVELPWQSKAHAAGGAVYKVNDDDDYSVGRHGSTVGVFQ